MLAIVKIGFPQTDLRHGTQPDKNCANALVFDAIPQRQVAFDESANSLYGPHIRIAEIYKTKRFQASGARLGYIECNETDRVDTRRLVVRNAQLSFAFDNAASTPACDCNRLHSTRTVAPCHDTVTSLRSN